jgi:hypothetical protein
VLALLFLTVCGVTVGGLLTFMNASSTATTALRVSRGSDYDALSAMQAAIASVRVGNPCGSGGGGYTPNWTLNNNTRPLRVDCVAVAPPVYDSTMSPLPHSIPSLPYEASSTAEIGDLISFSGTKRRLASVTVTLEDWALHSENPTWPAPAWQYPITLEIYKVDRSGATPAPGQLIVSNTQTFTIPWKPEPDPTCTGAQAGYWRAPDNGVCYSSVPANITFDLSALNVDLPDEVIFGVGFNTQKNGTAPTGASGPYSDLNFALSQSVSRGVDVDTGAIFRNSTFAGTYGDGGTAGVGIFRSDSNASLTPYTPAIQVVATDIPIAQKRNDLFSVCLTTAPAPCADSQALLRANVTFYDGQSLGKSLDVQTWSNR